MRAMFRCCKRCGRVAVPSVVGDIDEHFCAVKRELPYLVGEDRLVTDEDSDLHVPGIEWHATAAASEGTDLAGERLGEGDEILEWNEFAERYQMDFVVARDPLPAGCDQRSRVEDVRRPIAIASVINAHRPGDDVGIRRARQVHREYSAGEDR